MEQFVNFQVVTLSAPCLIGDMHITITNPTAFPTSGTYRLLIENEILEATSRAGSVVQVVRGTEGTSAAGHSTSTQVYAIDTAAQMAQFFADVKARTLPPITSPGTYAAVPGGEYFIDFNVIGGNVIITTAGTIGADQGFFVKIIDPSGSGTSGFTVTIQPIVAGEHIESQMNPGTFDGTSVSYILSEVGQEVELTSNDGANLWY